MRHLYAATPKAPELIDQAKTYERRRCNHHTLDQPLGALECLQSVVDPKGSRTNKHRYVVASQVGGVRSYMRSVPGVPLVYINRSVMIMEPMTSATEDLRSREERDKFRAGLKGKRGAAAGVKRKRDDEDEAGEAGESRGGPPSAGDDAPQKDKTKKTRGPKGPNPLSVKKPKKAAAVQTNGVRSSQEESDRPGDARAQPAEGLESGVKRKRKRKHKASEGAGDATGVEAKQAVKST